MAAGDTAAVAMAIAKARARCRLAADAPVRSCYEAGRDGFWLHRWLTDQGIVNLVVDPASIEVNRRARRAKTDRLVSDKLLSMLMRYYGGERRVWAVARIPTPEQEDERRMHRELGRLRQERTAHSNRIRSLLVLHNLRVERIGGRAWARWWAQQAGQLLPGLRAEIEREFERLSLVARQIRTLEAQQKQQVHSGAQPVIALLARLAGIGTGSAWTLVKELFGWRQFRNRREVAGCLGLAPTPYESGTSEVELGISKAGNKRARWLMVELAWSWLRFQPASQLSQWFNERFAGGGKRVRRIGIVALARRLAIALWRYLEQGELPLGARLKPPGSDAVEV
ncbi:IS110 family transposase ISGdi7 (plasmid) [Caballeronia sp. SBC2]|nr:IS110 family transposase ISGdi7 [Caballeronia sp. SBC2]